jgi:hypothetical protein
MTCLNDIHIQALADGEATPEAAHHAASCMQCGERLRQRLEVMAAIRGAIDVPVDLPRGLTESMDRLFRPQGETSGSTEPTGATRLRPIGQVGSSRLSSRTGSFRLQAEGHSPWIYGLGAVAATLIAVLFVAPMLKSPGTTVSAAEILAKSATQLSAAIASGIETLEYELVLDGVPKEMMPDAADGTYWVRQVIDHDVPGHFRFATFATDGTMMTSISQDPRRKQRVVAFTSEGQPYRFEMSLPAKGGGLSLPEMERLHMQASIAMMQAGSNQLLETVDGPDGRQYRIEMPHLRGGGTNPVWDLTEARALIDASDYRVTEFAVSGTFLKQAYSLSYKLKARTITSSVSADAFVIPVRPGEIVIKGEGTTVPTHDIVLLSLRELTKAKQER